MASARVHSDNLPSKRSRVQMQDDCTDSLVAQHEIEALKRSHMDGVAQQDCIDGLSLLQQRCLGSSSLVDSESPSESLEIEAAGVVLLQEGESSSPLVKERDSDGGVGDSARCGYPATCSKSNCSSYSADERAASGCYFDSFDKGISQSAEYWCPDDAQVDIASFLESWDDSVGDLLSAPHCMFEDNYCAHASLTGASDALSTLDVDEGEWCLNDVAAEAKRLWNEPLEQECMAVAVASLERCSNDPEPHT